MTTSYTTLLGLALPQTGDLSGTWGDTVNNSITQLVEDSVAGYATASVTAGDWTLTTTGSGVSNQARMMVLIPTGTPGTSRNIITPSHSKIYVVVNQSNASVVIKGAATTGVTIASGKTTVVAWNGSDFVEITPTNATNVVGGVQGSIPYQTAVNTTGLLAPGSADQPLVSGGSGANPKWSGVPISLGGNSKVSSIAIGSSALSANTTGTYNVAIGRDALKNNTTGNSNTAIGESALSSNTTGNSNTANGISALLYNTTGYSNTASGQSALQNNTTGNSNTANGYTALANNTTGVGNTASGNAALVLNTTGNYNTASGGGALFSNTTGSNNTASGNIALYSNTSGADNTASGYQALYSNTTGANNTASGSQALKNTTTGSSNTASGYQALYSNTTGANNTASGYQALYLNTTGNQNTASGRYALYNNTTGSLNIASGVFALYSNTTGNNNTAIGYGSLYSNTTGLSNTASGYQALYNNITGYANTANGIYALFNNTTGDYNTAIGFQALKNTTTGAYNTAIGINTLINNTTGSYNAALGGRSLTNNTTGSGNIAISPVNNAGTYAPVFDPTTEDNRVAIGSTSVTNAYIQVAWTVVSDARDKTNFNAIPHGLDFVNQLKPTAYQFRTARDSEETNGSVRYGFKAQDILALEGDTPVIIDNENPDKLRYNSDSLIPVLVNAIQELTARLQILENK